MDEKTERVTWLSTVADRVAVLEVKVARQAETLHELVAVLEKLLKVLR